MSNFSVVMFLLAGGAGLHLFQFVAVLRRLMGTQRAESGASDEITDIYWTDSCPAADRGARFHSAGLSRYRDTRRVGQRRGNIARFGAARHGQQPNPARQTSQRRYGRSRAFGTVSRRFGSGRRSAHAVI